MRRSIFSTIQYLGMLVILVMLSFFMAATPANAVWHTIMYENFEHFQGDDAWPWERLGNDWQLFPNPPANSAQPESNHSWGVEDSAIFRPGPDAFRAIWCYGRPNDRIPGFDDYGRGVHAWAKWGPFDLTDAVTAEGSIWIFGETEPNPDGDNFYMLITNNQQNNWQTTANIPRWCKVVQHDGSTGGEWYNMSFNFADVDTGWPAPDEEGDSVNYVGRDNVWIALVFQSDTDNNTDLGVFVDDLAFGYDDGLIDFEMGGIELYDLSDPPLRTWEPEEDAPYRVTFKFKASGPPDAPQTASHVLYIDGEARDTVRGDWDCSSTGTTHTVQFPYVWVPADTGLADIQVMLDVLEEVVELSEENNDSTITLPVQEQSLPPWIEWINPGSEPDYYTDENGMFHVVIHPRNSPSDENAYLNLYYDTDDENFDGYRIDSYGLIQIDNEILEWDWDIAAEDEVEEGEVTFEHGSEIWIYARLTDAYYDTLVYAPNPILWGNAVRSIDQDLIPENFEITGTYPNPFNPTVEVNVAMPSPGDIKAVWYSIDGRQVDTQTFTNVSAGLSSFRWSPRNLSSGVYFLQLSSPHGNSTAKVIYMK